MAKAKTTNQKQVKTGQETNDTKKDSKTLAPQMNALGLEILAECKKIALNQTSSCYIMVEKTKEYMAMEKMFN